MTRRTMLTAPLALGLAVPEVDAGAASRADTERPRRALLAGAWDERRLAEVLLPAEQWKPFPRHADRAAWQTLPASEKQAKIKAAERTLGTSWEPVPATLMLEYQRNGNRTRYEAASFGRRKRLRDLALAECMEGKGRFLDDLLNGVWLICEETWWGVPAHLGLQKAGTGLPDIEEPVVDLFASETASLLAWVGWLLGDQL